MNLPPLEDEIYARLRITDLAFEVKGEHWYL